MKFTKRIICAVLCCAVAAGFMSCKDDEESNVNVAGSTYVCESLTLVLDSDDGSTSTIAITPAGEAVNLVITNTTPATETDPECVIVETAKLAKVDNDFTLTDLAVTIDGKPLISSTEMYEAEIKEQAGMMWDMFASFVFVEATFGADGKVVSKIGDETDTSDYTVSGNRVCIKGDENEGDTVFVAENDGEKLVCADIESGLEVVMVRK